MLKKVALAILALSFTLPFFASATTLAELQSQIAVLIAQVSALQLRQGNQQQIAASATCPNLARNLFRSSRGADVTILQKLLISQDLLTLASATGFYGVLTEDAVKKFQCKHLKICSGTAVSNGFGVVGPKTRAAMRTACTTSVSITIPAPVVFPKPTDTPTLSTTPSPTVTPPVSPTPTPSSTSTSPVPTTPPSPSIGSCSVFEVPIANGASATFYNKPIVRAGSICAPHAQVRTCTNGTMSGDDQYHFAACTVSENANAISYPNPSANVPGIAAYPGTMRTEMMPNTLDLVDRANATINALIAPLYATGDYSLYWQGQINANPPRLNFGEWEDIDPKFWESLPLLRIMTGSGHGTNVDRAWEARAVKSFDPHYKLLLFAVSKPFIGFPYTAQEKADWASLKTGYVATVLSQGRIMGYLATMYRLTGNQGWAALGSNLIKVLPKYYNTMATGQAFYFSSSIFNPFGWPGGIAVPSSSDNADISGRMIQGPALFALAASDVGAVPLAKGFATFMMKYAGYFNFQTGAFLSNPVAQDEGPMGGAHFMRHSKVLDSLVDYVAATAKQGAPDQEALDFVIRSYEWVKAQHNLVNVKIGWFPEFMSSKSISTDYGVVDMISIGVKLSAMGYADYWDDVDAWTRNHFASQQLLDTSWIQGYSSAYTYDPVCENRAASRGCTFENVAQRLYGSWGGWVRPNEFTYQGGAGVMQDSTGNAARTLFHIWNSIVTRSGPTVSVNLPLNKVDRDITVKSYIPHSGVVEVVVHNANIQHVRIRIPGWASLNQLVFKKNGTDEVYALDGRYVVAYGPFAVGDTLRAEFPITESTQTFQLPSTAEGQKMDFTFTFRGNQVIDVTPDGTRGAFYTNTAAQRAPAAMVQKTGFILSNLAPLLIYSVPGVTIPPKPVSVTPEHHTLRIYANNIEDSITVPSGSSVRIHWKATGVQPNTCQVFGPLATPLNASNLFNGSGVVDLSAPGQGTPVLTQNSVYTLHCLLPNNTVVTDTVEVLIGASAHITATPSILLAGQSGHISWSYPGASVCAVYGPGTTLFNGSGFTNVPMPGQGTGYLTAETTYTLQCWKDGVELPSLKTTVSVTGGNL